MVTPSPPFSDWVAQLDSRGGFRGRYFTPGRTIDIVDEFGGYHPFSQWSQGDVVWTVIGEIASKTEPEKTYKIKRASNGALGCACLNFRFSKSPKSCDHVKAWKVAERLIGANHGS